MKLARTDRFKKAYRKLTANEQRGADKALSLLAEDLRHPSLQVKKIEGTRGIWEARATRSLRLSFEIRDDTLILRNIGDHDKVLRNPQDNSSLPLEV
jgi:mRNA interferase RelE/StbE